MEAQIKSCRLTLCAISKHHKRSSMPFPEPAILKYSTTYISNILLSPAHVLAISSLKPSSELIAVWKQTHRSPSCSMTKPPCSGEGMSWDTAPPNCHLPTREGCSEPGLTFFQKDKLKSNLASPNWAPSCHSPPQTLRGKYAEDLGTETVRCEPRLRTATLQLT